MHLRLYREWLPLARCGHARGASVELAAVVGTAGGFEGVDEAVIARGAGSGAGHRGGVGTAGVSSQPALGRGLWRSGRESGRERKMGVFARFKGEALARGVFLRNESTTA
jgi:hypothetical protein